MKKMMIFAAAALVSFQAQAVTVTTQTRTGSLDFGLLLLGTTVNINFDAFGIPTQRLTNVALSFSTGASATYNVANVNFFSGPLSRNITLVRGLSAGLTGNGFNLSGSNTVSKTQAVARGSLVNNFGVYAPQVTGSGAITSGFGAFANPVSFALNVQQSGNSISGSPNLGATTATINLLQPTSSNYTATLTYTSVPEPAAWMMLLTGFGLAGVALRRRTRLVAA